MLSNEDLKKIRNEALRAFRDKFSDHGVATSSEELSEAVANAIAKAMVCYDQLQD